VNVLHRSGKDGLGAAYRAGFRWGLERRYQVLVQMDADGSHRPEQLAGLLAALSPGVDLVLGSRWVPGGEVVDWPLHRELLSRTGNAFARLRGGGPSRRCRRTALTRHRATARRQADSLPRRGTRVRQGTECVAPTPSEPPQPPLPIPNASTIPAVMTNGVGPDCVSSPRLPEASAPAQPPRRRSCWGIAHEETMAAAHEEPVKRCAERGPARQP